MAEFEIHHQLRADCHYLGRLEQSHLLLHRNATVFWLILVPETEVTELHDMATAAYQNCMAQTKILAEFAKRYRKADKVNIAAIGNIVPQLHIHIIARNKDDPCWPGVVWGNLNNTFDYTDQSIDGIKSSLTHELDMIHFRECLPVCDQPVRNDEQ